ncbi:alpha/beta fold hydrolase [Sutcliffiella deserti]|uniref:alpha/beta fold hydrolase n=1 Tax=Sutcliffiella deserti TaxID=2875501 RepID=UPI001CC19B2C|nr:alpha/beta fold hydrolase [Sutcliffiella deserti]
MRRKRLSEWKQTMVDYNKLPYSDGVTTRQAIWKKNKATLWYYPSPQKKYNVPLFLVYSLVNRPFILDLMHGGSTIEAFVKEGYDVYLLDFGVPGLEDQDISIDDYILDYIQKGVQHALKHSGAKEVTLIGYCLGGTFAAIYGAIANEPIKNIILIVTPIDFSSIPFFDKWIKAFKEGEVSLDNYSKEIGILPASGVEAGMRMITSPIYYSPYLSLLLRADDPVYVDKWLRFNTWTKGHIPLTGKTAQQLTNDLVIENKLIKGNLKIRNKKVNLANISSNLLVVVTENDRLVPKEQSLPIMGAVSSLDKKVETLQGGHTGTTVKNGKLPDYLTEWLPIRSDPK